MDDNITNSWILCSCLCWKLSRRRLRFIDTKSPSDFFMDHFDGLVQERRNSIDNALRLRLSCSNPSVLCMRLANERRRYYVTSSLIERRNSQERRNSIANALRLRLSCSNPSVLCMRLANERRRYYVTSSLIGWAHTQMIPVSYTRFASDSSQLTQHLEPLM